MSKEEKIKKQFGKAAAAAELFLEEYYKARKTLEDFNSPASPKREKKGLSQVDLARIIGKRKTNIERQLTKTS